MHARSLIRALPLALFAANIVLVEARAQELNPATDSEQSDGVTIRFASTRLQTTRVLRRAFQRGWLGQAVESGMKGSYVKLSLGSWVGSGSTVFPGDADSPQTYQASIFLGASMGPLNALSATFHIDNEASPGCSAIATWRAALARGYRYCEVGGDSPGWQPICAGQQRPAVESVVAGWVREMLGELHAKPECRELEQP